MRPLTRPEIAAVSGGDNLEISLPAGASVTSRLEANQSTTLTFKFANGWTHTWNSGVWIACKIVSGGVGITAGTLGTPMMGALMSTLASVGCNYAATSNNTYDDGDS